MITCGTLSTTIKEINLEKIGKCHRGTHQDKIILRNRCRLEIDFTKDIEKRKWSRKEKDLGGWNMKEKKDYIKKGIMIPMMIGIMIELDRWKGRESLILLYMTVKAFLFPSNSMSSIVLTSQNILSKSTKA